MSAFIADLRERRLLPIIALLLVCLIAVPFLLGGGGEDASTPPPPTAATGEPLPGIEARPVVIASPAELRSYKQRLAEFRSHNPFHQDLPKPVTPAAGDESSASSASTTSSSDLPEASETAPIVPPPSTTPTGTGGDSSGSSGGKLIDMRIDVMAGRAGHLKAIKNVKQLDYLPDPQHPVAVFAGAAFNKSSASFIVSPGIEATDGDGNCAPSPDNCQFLQLKPGQQQHFVYRAEDYTLKLIEVKRHVESIDEADLQGKDAPDSPRGAVSSSSTAIQGG
jgi:hypothetical protein